MAYDAATVANRFIDLASEEGQQLTSMQLNKLSYIAHGFKLALDKEPLLSDRVEAWRYGPVIPTLYRRLKSYGSGPVTTSIAPVRFKSAQTLIAGDDAIVQAVYNKYGRLTGSQLSYLTHKVGTPWHRAYNPDIYGIEIDNAVIGQHYADLLRG